MPPLRRHLLAFLSTDGWREVLARPWDDQARDCLAHWAALRLPLVVTRQRVPRPTADAPLSLGLSAPERWGRRLLALQLAPAGIAWFEEFPLLQEALPELPRSARAALQDLAAELAGLGVRARAYGSVGWQRVTGLPYLHERSDLDLWLAVDEAEQADAAAAALQRCAPTGLRLDGELMFADGSAVAWREWTAWRHGAYRTLLVKRLHGAALERSVGRFAPAEASA